MLPGRVRALTVTSLPCLLLPPLPQRQAMPAGRQAQGLCGREALLCSVLHLFGDFVVQAEQNPAGGSLKRCLWPDCGVLQGWQRAFCCQISDPSSRTKGGAGWD